jgi:hypothetical protein
MARLRTAPVISGPAKARKASEALLLHGPARSRSYISTGHGHSSKERQAGKFSPFPKHLATQQIRRARNGMRRVGAGRTRAQFRTLNPQYFQACRPKRRTGVRILAAPFQRPLNSRYFGWARQARTAATRGRLRRRAFLMPRSRPLHLMNPNRRNVAAGSSASNVVNAAR